MKASTTQVEETTNKGCVIKPNKTYTIEMKLKLILNECVMKKKKNFVFNFT